MQFEILDCSILNSPPRFGEKKMPTRHSRKSEIITNYCWFYKFFAHSLACVQKIISIKLFSQMCLLIHIFFFRLVHYYCEREESERAIVPILDVKCEVKKQIPDEVPDKNYLFLEHTSVCLKLTDHRRSRRQQTSLIINISLSLFFNVAWLLSFHSSIMIY